MRRQQAALKAHYASMSPNERYKATQQVARNIFLGSTAPKTTSHKEYMEDFLTAVQKKGGFSGEVAATVLKSMKYNNYGMVANMSEKQSWVLAKAAVEHGIKYK